MPQVGNAVLSSKEMQNQWFGGERGVALARRISVHREAGAESLFDEPLGSESAVREFWSEPAEALGLPLLAAIYEHGFYHGNRWSGPQIRQVLDEVALLEKHWASLGLANDVTTDLYERAGYLRAAAKIAEDCGGLIDIV